MVELILGYWQELILYSTFVSLVLFFFIYRSYSFLGIKAIKNKGSQQFDIEIYSSKLREYNAKSISSRLLLVWLPKTIKIKIGPKNDDDYDGFVFLPKSKQAIF